MSIDELKAAYDQAEADVVAAQTAKDENKNADTVQALREAIERAAAAQKAWCDADAAQALVGQPDAERIAASLGLQLPAG